MAYMQSYGHVIIVSCLHSNGNDVSATWCVLQCHFYTAFSGALVSGAGHGFCSQSRVVGEHDLGKQVNAKIYIIHTVTCFYLVIF
jgi:hypothetical protein